MTRLVPLLLLSAAMGCETATTPTFETCAVEVALEPSSALPGTEVVAVGGPYLRDDSVVGDPTRDTVVSVGGTEATVVSVSSTDAEGTDVSIECDLCFECREVAECAACGACAGRQLDRDVRATCFTGAGTGDDFIPGACDLCEQRVVFRVPKGLAAGPHTVSLVNRFGMSTPVELTVLPQASKGQ